MTTFATVQKAAVVGSSRKQPTVEGRSFAARQGSQAQLRLILKGTGAQPKLRVGAAGDACEREADRVADQVASERNKFLRQAPEATRHSSEVRRQLAEATTGFQRQEGGNNKDEKVRAKPVAGESSELSAPLEGGISALHGAGERLSEPVRAYLEPQIGADFSAVRVHTGPEAEELARAVNARAFTRGSEVVFGTGEYAPGTAGGLGLLAHELVHVVQQAGVRPVLQRQLAQPPTKLITSYVQDISFPSEDEASLDNRIKSRRIKAAPDGKGKYIGNVTYRNLPDPSASLERRAVKHALEECVSTDILDKNGIEMRVRVPLDAMVQREFAMVVLRFDAQRNVQVEYAGKDLQSKGSLLLVEETLKSLAANFGVTFVTSAITAKLPGQANPGTFPGKTWSSNDVELLRQAMGLLRASERAVLTGCKIRRLAGSLPGAVPGFYLESGSDRSINLTDAALPTDKTLWFGEGGRFYSRGVHTALHEIGHALHEAAVPAGSPAGAKVNLDLFKNAVRAESRRRTNAPPGATFPPKGIVLPTHYARTSWLEFYADTYAIYRTNPSFLGTPEFQYLYDFFHAAMP